MTKQINILIPDKYSQSVQLEVKVYHKPHLTEWGNLQVVTRGGRGKKFDSNTMSDDGSRVKVRPQPITPIYH